MGRHADAEAPLVGAEAPASTEATMMEAWMLVEARAEALCHGGRRRNQKAKQQPAATASEQQPRPWMALGARGAGCRTLGREQLRGADTVI